MYIEEKTEQEYCEQIELYIDNRQGEYLAYLEWKAEQEKEEKKSENSGELVFQM